MSILKNLKKYDDKKMDDPKETIKHLTNMLRDLKNYSRRPYAETARITQVLLQAYALMGNRYHLFK